MAIGRTPGSSSSPSSGEHSPSGLLAVLERAEARPPAGRPRPRRAVVHSAASARGRRALPAARPVPQLRPRPPAPAAVPPAGAGSTPASAMWRPAGSPDRPAAPTPQRRSGLARRLALWGAGPGGAHLAWNRPAPAPVPEPVPSAPLRARLRRGVRRLALWGAGPTGAHLAWNVPPQPRVYSLRLPPLPATAAAGLPGIPPNEPAASSPAAALLPVPRPRAAGSHLLRAPARPPRASQPRASEPTGWPAVRPEPCPALPAPSGWPIREAPGPRAGTRSPVRARTRGDPAPCRIRGSPP